MSARATDAGRTAVYIESGTRRVFACALDWPGWCRSGRDEGQALEALAAAGPRYAVVAAEADVRFPEPTGQTLHVVERLPGSGTTDFGAPGEVSAFDAEPLTEEQAERAASLVAAAWTVFDRIAAAAPAELRKGPRGGGRNRDAIVAHVNDAEQSYARMLGIRRGQAAPGANALRAVIHQSLRSAREATPAYEKGWPPRYAARRIAWHVLDHAWEIEDRSQPGAS